MSGYLAVSVWISNIVRHLYNQVLGRSVFSVILIFINYWYDISYTLLKCLCEISINTLDNVCSTFPVGLFQSGDPCGADGMAVLCSDSPCSARQVPRPGLYLWNGLPLYHAYISPVLRLWRIFTGYYRVCIRSTSIQYL